MGAMISPGEWRRSPSPRWPKRWNRSCSRPTASTCAPRSARRPERAGPSGPAVAEEDLIVLGPRLDQAQLDLGAQLTEMARGRVDVALALAQLQWGTRIGLKPLDREMTPRLADDELLPGRGVRAGDQRCDHLGD